MPIRLNLLAEQFEAEEQRRRDPAKRTLWVAGFVVGLLALWAAYMQLKVLGVGSQVADVEAKYRQIQARYGQVRTNQDRLVKITQRVDALQRLAANRFLWGTPLNALQFAIVPHVQLVRFRTEQTFAVTDAGRPTTNASGVVRSTPATSRETTLMKLDARDYSSTPGEQIPAFLEVLNNHPWFRTNLMKAELAQRAAPQTDPGEPSPYVLFIVECKYPERSR